MPTPIITETASRNKQSDNLEATLAEQQQQINQPIKSKST